MSEGRATAAQLEGRAQLTTHRSWPTSRGRGGRQALLGQLTRGFAGSILGVVSLVLSLLLFRKPRSPLFFSHSTSLQWVPGPLPLPSGS